MSEFRAGNYRRDSVSPLLRHVTPSSATHSLFDIDPAELAAKGKKLVLLDVDNTLLPWRGESLPPESIAWVEKAKGAGLSLCIVSNTRHPDRLNRLASQLGIKALRGKFKPSRQMFLQAMQEFAVRPEEAVMIGDQLFTDVLGANRCGIDAIWVRPMTTQDFVGTKFSRLGERIVRTMVIPEPDGRIDESTLPVGGAGAIALLQVPVVRQFVKFGVVGGSSMAIDLGLHFVLMFFITIGGEPLAVVLGEWLKASFPSLFSFAKDPSAAAWPVLKVLTSGLAIVNSFIWNRRWTFGIKSTEDRGDQFRKFLLVSVLGMVLNTFITTGFNNIIPGHPKRSWAIASGIGVVIVAFWNFTGQKFFAFRKRS